MCGFGPGVPLSGGEHRRRAGADSGRTSLELIRYRRQHARDWTARELGVVAHAETVRIHPFVDGNGRTTRLLGDLVFVAAQDGEFLEQYDWALDKVRYIDLLRSTTATVIRVTSPASLR